jgi:hypothetical protein
MWLTTNKKEKERTNYIKQVDVADEPSVTKCICCDPQKSPIRDYPYDTVSNKRK